MCLCVEREDINKENEIECVCVCVRVCVILIRGGKRKTQILKMRQVVTEKKETERGIQKEVIYILKDKERKRDAPTDRHTHTQKKEREMKYTRKKTDRRRGTERTERNREDEVYMKGKEINMQRGDIEREEI